MSQAAAPSALALWTRDPRKAELYGQETYLREALLDLEAVLGEDTPGTVLRHGLIVVKPDGRALGATSAVVDFCAGHGFDLVDARRIVFAPTVWRSLWIYQMTEASIDRLLINDLVIAGDAVALLLRSRAAAAVPAAVRLSALKGSARKERQDAGCLRRAIGQPDRVLSLVHSADEPVDLVRELGILFGFRERREMARAMASGRLSAAGGRLLTQIRRSDAAPSRTFDRGASRQRVIEAVRARMRGAEPAPPSCRETLGRALDALDRGVRHADLPFPTPAFLAALHDLDLRVDPWDLAVALSDLIEEDAPGGSKIIENLGIAEWEDTP
jgi:nucleoside diphosphate kinase